MQMVWGPVISTRGWRGTGEDDRHSAAPRKRVGRGPEAPTHRQGRKRWFSSAAGGEIQQDGCFVSA